MWERRREERGRCREVLSLVAQPGMEQADKGAGTDRRTDGWIDGWMDRRIDG